MESDARRVSQDLILRNEGGGAHLNHHESGMKTPFPGEKSWKAG